MTSAAGAATDDGDGGLALEQLEAVTQQQRRILHHTLVLDCALKAEALDLPILGSLGIKPNLRAMSPTDPCGEITVPSRRSSRANGKKGGRPKGRQSQQTLDKQAAEAQFRAFLHSKAPWGQNQTGGAGRLGSAMISGSVRVSETSVTFAAWVPIRRQLRTAKTVKPRAGLVKSTVIT